MRLTIGWQWLVIMIAGTLAVHSGQWWAYVLAALVIGSRQQALGVLVHDATHYLLFTNRRVNDLVSDLFCAFPLGISTTLYRHTHFKHHRFTNTEGDPDWVWQQQDIDWAWPNAPRMLGMLLRSVTGWNMPKMAKVYLVWSPWKHLFTPISPAFPLSTRILYVVTSPIVYAVLIPTGLWKPVLILWLLPSLTLFNVFNRIRDVRACDGPQRS